MKVRARRVLSVVVAFVSMVVVGMLVAAAPALASGKITVAKAGAGASTSTVTSNPAGISCGSGTECEHEFGGSKTVILTAEPGPGYVFEGWSGATSCKSGGGESPTCEWATGLLGTGFTVTATFVVTPPPPSAFTEAPAVVGEMLVTMSGQVNPDGAKVESCRFEYGATTAYGASVPCSSNTLGEGTAEVPVSAQTESLEPGVTYHYRLVASNKGGVSRGADATFTTAGVTVCPNAAQRLEQGIAVLLLPDCMALEMVSPPLKSDQAANTPAISTDGERVLFYSTAPLGETTGVRGVTGDPYVASRGTSGWVTASTMPPNEYLASSFLPTSFTPDLSRWLEVGSTFGQVQVGSGQAFQGGLGGLFVPLSQVFTSTSGSKEAIFNLSFRAASADHSHLYLAEAYLNLTEAEKEATFLPGDPVPAGSAAGTNVYVAFRGSSGEPLLRLLARDANGKVWGGRCGVQMGGDPGAVSANGVRVYFTARAAQPQTGFCSEANKLRIMRRVETSEGPWISELFSSECTRASPACSTVEGSDSYKGASVDGSMVYFTTNRQLVNSDLDGSNTECSTTTAVVGCDLYLYNSKRPVGQRLIQVSAGETNAHHEAGKEADVFNGVTAISGDGSRVYYVADGVLTEHPNPVGAVAQHGQPNLYVYDAKTGDTAFIGTLSSGDAAGLWSSNGSLFQSAAYPVPLQGRIAKGEEVGGDGHVLVFESKASLTTNDTDGGHNDVFRYDASVNPPMLECVSCRPGVPDSEPFDTELLTVTRQGTDFAELGRWVNEDGDTILFTTAEPLVPGDANGVADSYMWREGQLYRLPGRNAVLSPDGSEIAFQTATELLPQDGDNATDVYVARADGGFPVPPVSEACQGEACQGPFGSPTVFGIPGSVAFSESGNQWSSPPSVPVVKKKSLTRVQKFSGALAACKKKPKKRRAACRARARKKYGPVKQTAKKDKAKRHNHHGKGSK